MVLGEISAQNFIEPNLKISAHRGNSMLAPENTLATFRKVLAMGVDFIEIDVRTSSDGALVILHDGNLDRTTDGQGPIKNLSLKEIRKLSAGKGYGPEFAQEQIPTLEETCQLLEQWNKNHRHQTYIYVDCKQVAAQALIDILLKYNLALESVFYGNDVFLKDLKQVYPQAKLLPALKNKEEIFAKTSSLQPYAFDVSWPALNQELIDEIHSKGIFVFTDLLGPFDKPENYIKAKKLKIDLIQTDHVKSVKETWKVR
jgi:glycerophosphoryl diester phosphodiesterase